MERARRTLLTALAAVVVVAAATALAWYRLGPVTRATVWAEDGGPFWRDHLTYGWGGSLLRPYAGYLHLLPRIVVDLAFTRPVEAYAVTVAAACCLIAGVVAGTVFVLARDVVPAWPLRLVLAAVPVVLPIAPFEISGNAADLHWYMLVLVPWLFAFRARSWWGAVVVAVLALGAVLTEPQTLLFTPLLLVAWWRPTRRARSMALPVTVVTVVAGCVQVVTALTTDRISRPGSPTVADVVHGYLLQPLAGAWTADVGAVAAAVGRDGPVVVVAPAVAVALVLVAAVTVGSGRARALVLALGTGSGAVWAAALVANASADGHWGERSAATFAAAEPTRYAAAAAMLLVSALVVAAAVLVDARSWSLAGDRRVLRIVGAVLGWATIVVVVAAAVTNVAPGTTQRSDGPAWRPQVEQLHDVCSADPGSAPEVRTAPWAADVPCRLVLGER